MWLFSSKKQKKKETKKISNSFKKRDTRLSKVEDELKGLKNEFVTRKEFELLMNLIKSGVHEPTSRSPQTTIRRKANKLLDKAEIMHEIASMSQKGLSTQEIQHNIIDVQGLCKKTCFFKYLKIVREQSPRTTRGIKAN